MKKTKILFLINSLGGGGAERVLVNLVNNMNVTKYDITVQTMFGDGVNREFLSSNIKYKSTNAPCPKGISFIYRFVPASWLYRFFIGSDKYDVLIAYMHGSPVKVISGCKDKKVRKIAWLHNENIEKGVFFKCWYTKKMAFRVYDCFDAIVGVARTVTEKFAVYTGIHGKLHTVYNTNDSNRILKMAQEKANIIHNNGMLEICTAGRLVPQKGYDRLISVAKKLHEEGFGFHISILGTGSDSYKEFLQSLIQNCEAGDYISLLGFQQNPYAIMAQSDLYVLSSRGEGLATVLTEALFIGLPIVATDVSGTREVLGDNNEYGIVVENSEEGIYHGLKRILQDTKLLKYYKERSKERATFFETAKTVKQAEDLIDYIINL